MIPSEYRLERVAAGLIERLDSARRSFPNAEAAREGFARIADEHLNGVLAEWRDMAFVPDADKHAEFLRREVHETFLPRFTQIATSFTASERGGHGLGPLASPGGRIGLVVFALMFLGLVLIRFEYNPLVWVLTLLDLALPFLPDILGRMQLRSYEANLRETLGDMKRIQDQAARYTAAAGAGASHGQEAAERERRAAAQRAREAGHGGG